MKKKYIIIIILTLVISIGIGTAFAYYTFSAKTSSYLVTVGTMKMDFKETSNYIEDKINIMNDNLGKINNNFYEFNLTGTNSYTDNFVKYEIGIETTKLEKIDPKYIKFYLTDSFDNQITNILTLDELIKSQFNESKVLYNGIIDYNSKIDNDYRLRVWIDEDLSNEGYIFNFKVTLYSYNEQSSSREMLKKLNIKLDENNAGTIKDEYGESIYFKEPHYVNWANKDWYLLRINGDGSLRLLAKDKLEKTLYSNVINSTSVDYFINSELEDNLYNDTVRVNSEMEEVELNGNIYFYKNYDLNVDTGNVELKDLIKLEINEGKAIYKGKEHKVDSNFADLLNSDLLDKYLKCTNLDNDYNYGLNNYPIIKVVSFKSEDSKLFVSGNQLIRTLDTSLNELKNVEKNTYNTIYGEANSTLTNTLNGYYNSIVNTDTLKAQVKDNIFCNNKNILNDETKYFGIKNKNVNNRNIGYEKTIFEATNKEVISLVCPINDRYTVLDNLGNKKLENPIGLLTYEEINLIGLDTYLKEDYIYWTGTPVKYENNLGYVYAVKFGELTPYSVDTNLYLKPVINIDNKKVEISGTGTLEDPYLLK